MDLSLTPEQQQFRDELRTWLQANAPSPWSGSKAEEEKGPYFEYLRKWQGEVSEGGWAAISWPKEYGGRDAKLIEMAILQEEWARAEAPPLINSLGLYLIGPTIISVGTEEQKARFLRKIVSAEEIWCQGFSEPNAGSDVASLATKATLDGDHFVVNGQKIWTSLAHMADWCLLLTRTDQNAPKHKGISFLLVDMHSPGVTVRPLKQISGDEDFNEVFFEDVRVPRANLVGAVNGGWDIAITTLMHERQTLTFSRQLQSRVALSELLTLARRHPPHAPAARQPLLRQKLAAACIDSTAMKYTALRNLTTVLRGGTPGPE